MDAGKHATAISGARETAVEVGHRRQIIKINTSTLANLGAGILIKGFIRGVSGDFLIDSGSERTVITPEMYHSLPKSCRPELNKDWEIVQADGSPLEHLGCAFMDVQIGPVWRCVLVVVAKLEG